MARALGGRESLGQVAALAQSDAVLEAGAALRRALGRDGKSGGVRAKARCLRRLKRGGFLSRGRRLTSDQSRVTHFGGQDWLLHASCSMGRWVRQWTSSSVSSSAGLIFLMHRTDRVLIPPSHVFPHSDQSPINHLEEKRSKCRIFKHLCNGISYAETAF